MSNQIFPVIGATQVTIVAPIPVPTQDVSDGTPGTTAPLTSLQIAGSDGTNLQTVSTDVAGRVNVNIEGHNGGIVDAATGAAVPDHAIQVGGTDGTDLRAILTDTSGREVVVGAAASGAVVTGNPVLVAGQDGTDARTLLTDSAGREVIVGAAAPGAVPVGNPVLAAGQDGTDVRTLLTDTAGRQEIVGAAASGAAVTGNPVLVAGQDGTDARTLLTDNTGQLKVLVEGGTGIPVTGTVTAEIEGHAGGVLDAVVGAAIPANAVLIGASESGNIEPLLLDASGFLKVNVAAGSSGNAAASATGSPVPADADYLGASDGTNLVGLLVESATHPNLRVALYNGTQEAALDAQGGQKVAGEAASGSAVTGNPVLVAGQDGTNARTLLTDTSGRVENVGAAASGSAVAGNPVLVAGQDGTNARTILTDTTGQVKVLVEGGTGIPVTNAGTFAVQAASTIADGADVTQGAKADAKSTATDTTPVSIMSVLKEISFMEQTPASRAVTNTGTFAVQEATLDGAISGGKVKVSAAAGDVVVEISDGTTIIGTTLHPVQVADQANGSVAPGTAGTKSELQGHVYTAAGVTLTDGQQAAAQADSAGNLRVNPFGDVGSFSSVQATATKTSAAQAAPLLTVPAGTKWLLKSLLVQDTLAGTGTFTLTARIIISDASSQVLFDYEDTGTAFSGSSASVISSRHNFFPASTTRETLIASAAFAWTQCPIPEMVLGPGFLVEFLSTMAGTQTTTHTYSLNANVIALPD